LLALVGWLVMVVLSVGLFLASIPAHYESLTSFAGTELDPVLVRDNLERMGVSVDFYATYSISTGAVMAAVWVAVSMIIFLRRPDDRMAIFTAVALTTCAVFFLNSGPIVLAEKYPVVWLPVRLLALFGSVSFMAFLYLFPNGRFVPRWARWLVLFWFAHEVAYYLFPDSITSIERISPLLEFLVPLIDFSMVLTVLCIGLGSQLYRFRRVSGPVERQQTKWVVFGTVSSLSGLIALQALLFSSPTLLNFGSPYSFVIVTGIDGFMLLIPLSIGAAILHRRLWDIDIVINRTLVYGILTAVVVGVYVLLVGGLGALLHTRGNLAVSLLAAGLVAVLFAPLRERLQPGVNRLMYGERDEPYTVLSRLGRRLGAAIEPGTVLPTIVETVAGALKLPYAAISIRRGEDDFEVAGAPTGEETEVPLTYGGETVGRLLLAPRTPGEQFSPADRSLLEDLARNAEVAVYAVRLTDDLQRSRERLVTAGEEERRRLRRDLHDGLGPTLASLTLGLDVSLRLLKKSPDEAEEMLSRLKAQTKEAVVDIRRLVYGLRPPPSTTSASSPPSGSRRRPTDACARAAKGAPAWVFRSRHPKSCRPCPRPLRLPATASPRRPSPTLPATPGPRSAASASPSIPPGTRWASKSPMTAKACRTPPRTDPASASPPCANGPKSSAEGSPSPPSRKAAPASPFSSRSPPPKCRKARSPKTGRRTRRRRFTPRAGQPRRDA